jgi:hypothetical protein
LEFVPLAALIATLIWIILSGSGLVMTKQKPGNDEEAWRNAKKLCRLNRRQVEMARALGMNPKKLRGLRPSPNQKWKLPVGAFIEACYRKRFPGLPEFDESRPPRRETGSPPETARQIDRTPIRQAENLVCFFANLSDDLGEWLAYGEITPEVLAAVRDELRDVANALEHGAAIPEIPGIPVPSGQAPVAPRRNRTRAFNDDDDIPF